MFMRIGLGAVLVSLGSVGCSGQPASVTAVSTVPQPAAQVSPAPAVASTGAPVDEMKPGAVVPSRFRGEWNVNLEHCGSGLNDSRLRITQDRVQHYESAGPVLAVVARGPDLALIAEMSGEGETWLSLGHYRLSADENQLADVTSSVPLTRYRCPTQAN